jgi:hypothetical protein
MMKVAFAFLITLSLSGTAWAAFDPNNPGASGYTLVFNENFPNASSIDLSDTRAPGFNWYIHRFFTNDTMPAYGFSVGTTCDSASQCLSSLNINPTFYTAKYCNSRSLSTYWWYCALLRGTCF